MFYVKQTATDADWSRETDTGPKCNAAWQNCTFPVEARTHTGFIWVLCSGAVLWFVVGTSRWVEMGRDVWVCAQVRVHVYWMNDFSIARLLPEEACNRLCPLLQGRSKLSAARHWARAPSGSVCVCYYYYSFCGSLYLFSPSPVLTQAWVTECGEWRAHERGMNGERASESYRFLWALPSVASSTWWVTERGCER